MVLVKALIFVLVTLVVKYLWPKRWLYYYGLKIQGPFAWPLIGSAYVLYDRHNGDTLLKIVETSKQLFSATDFYKMLMRVVNQNPPIFKIWVGSELVIINSNPKDAEICLNSCLEKASQYRLGEQFFKNDLLTAPVNVWKRHRKIINPAFSSTVLTSFLDIFAKHSIELVEHLRSCQNVIDVFPKMWRSTLNIACETLADIDPNIISGQDEYLKNIMRVEEIIAIRAFSLWLHPDFIWKRSALGKELQLLCDKIFDFSKQLLKTKKLHDLPSDNMKKRKFLNSLLDPNNRNNNLTEKEILDETHILIIAGSETTAIAISFVLQVLGIYKDVQEKVHQELCTIFGNSTRNPTLEDLNRMNYLEAVIKETFRLLPPVPFILRYIHKDLKIDERVFPEGSTMIIPMAYMNKREDFWTDPQTFNPDRFLSDETKNQHRCTFIPFSFGPRNCIGLRYGMISMKTMLSTVIRNFKMHCLDYKSIEDIDISFSIVAKAKSYILQLEPRTSSKEF